MGASVKGEGGDLTERCPPVCLVMPNGRRADQAVGDVRGKMTLAVLGSPDIPSSGLQGANMPRTLPSPF